MFKPQKTRNLGKYAFVTMLVGGLTFIWIYSRLSESLNLQTLATLQQTMSRVGFTEWRKITLLAFSARIVAFLARGSGTKGTLTFILRWLSYVHANSPRPQRSALSCTAGSPGEIRTPVSR